MKKNLFFAAAALAVLGSCTQGEEMAVVSSAEQSQAEGNIEFATYNSRAAVSRAGWEGSIRDAELKDNTKAQGFGVFAFHTGTLNYNNGDHELDGGAVKVRKGTGTTPYYPNFMYNERVYWDATNNLWKYDILRPWPNGNATADQSGATGDATLGTEYGSKVSFFAYAPYVPETTTWSGETDGIVGMSANDHAGNPTIDYTLASDGKSVDLLWGTCPTTASYETVNGTDDKGTWYDPDKNTGDYFSATEAASFNGDESLFPVNINLNKQKTGQKVQFLFKHALAKIGGATEKSVAGGTSSDADNKAGLLVILDIDKDGAITGGTKPDYTKVLLRDVKISCSQQMKDTDNDGVADGTGASYREALKNKGTLDLATGRWLIDAASTGSVSYVATSDGTTDAALTAASNATINPVLAEPASVAKTAAAWEALPAGVLSTATTNVYGNSDLKETTPLVLIPGTIPVLEFQIDYVVRVKDGKLKDAYTEVKQRITKTVEFTKAVELNKKYNILMRLGLNNIKFEATVDNWESTGDGTTPNIDTDNDGTPDIIGTEVHLPINVN